MTGPATVPTTGASGAATVAPIRYWRRIHAPVRGFAPGPWYRSPWAWEAAFRADPIDYLLASFRTFGDVVCIRAVPFRSLFLAHPEHIKHVLQDNARNYVKGIVIAKMKVVIGEGLFTSEGDFWRRQRRLSQPAFHRDRLAGFATAMTETTAAMLDRWASRARSGAPFDVAADMSALTLGIVGRALFSRVLDTEADEVGAAQTEALAIINERAIRFFPPPTWWPSRTNRRLRRAIAVLDRVVYDIIEARRRTGEQPGDLLAMLLLARDEETGAGMTDRQLRDEVMTFLLAGHETTAVALTWTWYLLDRNPDVAERLRGEVGAADRDAHADAGGPPAAALRADGRRGDDAPLPAGVGVHAPGPGRGSGGRIPHPEALGGDDLAVRHPPPPGLLGRSRALRSRALQARAEQRAPTVRLSALQWRSEALHRERVRAHGGAVGGRDDGATLPTAPRARHAGGARVASHAATARRPADGRPSGGGGGSARA